MVSHINAMFNFYILNFISEFILVTFGMIYIAKTTDNYKSMERKCARLGLTVFLINNMIVMQAVLIDSFLQVLLMSLLNHKSKEFVFLISNNILNITLYLMIIIFIYKFKDLKKTYFGGYILAIIPYYQICMSYDDGIRFIVNIVIGTILSVIIGKYIIDNRFEIKKVISEKVEIKVRYLFIPLFGFILIFLKLVIDEKIRIRTILLLALCTTYICILGFIMSLILVYSQSILTYFVWTFIFTAVSQLVIYFLVYGGYVLYWKGKENE